MLQHRVVRLKFVPYSKIQSYGISIASKTKGDRSNLPEVLQEVQRKQFLENVEKVSGFYVGEREITNPAEFYELGDVFHKMSQRTGISSQALSELAHAAELSGSSISDVENGFRVLSKRMSDAQIGLDSAERTFGRLGISVTDATGHLRGADAVFMDAVSALNGISSETEKAALAQELFGRSGTMLLPLIRSGTVGIAEMREEARKLGITFDDQAAAQSAAFNDELTRIKANLLGVRNTISLEFMPYVTGLSSAINKEFIEMRQSGELKLWAEEAADGAINTFETIAFGAATMADTLSPVVRGLYGEVGSLWDQYKRLPTWAQEVGLVGLFVGGKKGAVVLAGALHMTGVVRNQVRAMEEIGRGALTLGEFAGMNATELEERLRQIDEKRQGAHPLNLSYAAGGPDDPFLPMPPAESYTAALETLFAKVRQKRDELFAGFSQKTSAGGSDTGGLAIMADAQVKAFEEYRMKTSEVQFQAQEDYENSFLDRHLREIEAVDEKNRQIISLEQTRANIVGVAYQSMQDQMLSLIETGQFSVGAMAQIIAQQVKMELTSIAARSAAYAIYETAAGLAASSGPWGLATFGNPAAHFASAAKFAAVSGVALAGAAATQGLFGGTAERPAPGTVGGEPIRTTPAAGANIPLSAAPSTPQMT